MGFKVFIDANCLLDLTLQRGGFQNANIIIQEGLNGKIKLYTSPAILHVVAYYTTQQYKKHQSKQIILTLLNDITIIDCDHGTALIAMNSSFEDVEDALQYYTALKHAMDYFISGDKKLKSCSVPQLPVFTMGEFVKQLKVIS